MIAFFVIAISFYFLILLQMSFLFHISFFGFVFNLPFFIVVLINFFEKQKENLGIISAIVCGFLFDIFSNQFFGINFIGFYIIVLLLVAVFIKFFIKKYFQFNN